MNILLLHQNDFIDKNKVLIRERRFKHLIEVQRVQIGKTVQLGLVNNHLGQGKVIEITEKSLTLDILLNQPPPQALPLILVIALPRPKMLKRILQSCATLGVKQIVLINSYRVEKSYWQSPVLSIDFITKQFELGLEQGKDTVFPTISLEKRFKPFVEDKLPSLLKNSSKAFVAHPGSLRSCPKIGMQRSILILGPEGGFIPYELEKLVSIGCENIHLGERILKVETAIPALLTQLFF